MSKLKFKLQRFAYTKYGTSRNDKLDNSTKNALIYAYGGNDSVKNSGTQSTIYGGNGNDSVYNTANYSKIYGDAGNDILKNIYATSLQMGRYSTIFGGNGNDSVYNYYGHDVKIDGGADNDTIHNYYGYRVTTDGGAGSDLITVYSGYANSINGGAGNDKISVSGSLGYQTIKGGLGNDTIYGDSAAQLYQYANGDGYDTLYNVGTNDTLEIYATSYSTVTSGNNAVVKVGNGSINLVGARYKMPKIILHNTVSGAVVNGTSYNDTIKNDGSSAKIYGGNGNDSIYNSADKVTISSGDGNDTVYNGYDHDVKIDGGAGNDSIINYGSNVTTYGGAGNDTINIYRGYTNSINGGAGNDRISVSRSGSYQTIKGGLGNDTIYGDSAAQLYQYANGDGYDTLYNVGTNDTIYISGGNFSTVTSGNNVIVKVGNGAMTLINAKGKVPTIVTATIENTVQGAKVYGTSNNDTIWNKGAKSTVYGYAGADSIRNSADKVSISAGEGNDTVYNYGDNVSIVGDNGNDYIYNSQTYQSTYGGNYALLSGGSGNDTISNAFSKYVKVYGGEGNDSIFNSGDYALLSGDGGNDTIYNSYDRYVTTAGGAGNDRIDVRGSSADSINGGAGNDFITVYGGSLNSINGDADNDFITVHRSSADSINGGAGNDTISIRASQGEHTIIGGLGNDKIYGDSVAQLYQYANGDGYDTLYNVGTNDTISISGGNFSTLTSGNNVILKVGNGSMNLIGVKSNTMPTIIIKGGKAPKHITLTAGNDTYKNTVEGATIWALGGKDTITNTGASVLVYGGAGNDSLVNNAAKVTISGDADNDYIFNNTAGENTSISGGAGNDIIFNYGVGGVTINGGDGNDSIISYNNWYNTTSISGGAGNDTIKLGNNANNRYIATINGGLGNDKISLASDASKSWIEYKSGDGNDSIVGFTANTTLKIGNGTTDTYSKSKIGNNVMVTVGSGVVTLSGASTLSSVNIKGKEVKTRSSVTAQEVIKKFMKSLDTTNNSGIAALNEAISIASGGHFVSIQTAINEMVKDCKSAKDSSTFLQEKCGIILNNSDTGAITGSDAGGSTIKDASGIVPETGNLESSFTSSSFTVDGLKVTLEKSSDLNDPKKKYIWQAFKTWWAKGALDLIAESYGENYGFSSKSSAYNKSYTFIFERAGDDYLAAANPYNIYVNMDYYDNIIVGNKDGHSAKSGSIYLDRVLAHELTHAVMMNNVGDYTLQTFYTLPQFITEGMAELTHGIDDTRRSRISDIANSSTRLTNALDLNNHSTGNNDSYAGGYMFLRYLAKQGSENYGSYSNIKALTAQSSNISLSGSILTATSKPADDIIDLTKYSSSVRKVDASKITNGVMIIGNTYANSLKSGKGADTISANTGDDTLYGGAGNDILYGDAGNDILYGETGNDTLSGGTGNDTLTGGAGNDLFVYITGNDYVTDYTVGQDKIKLSEGTIYDVSLNGSNVVLKVNGRAGTGTLTVAGAKNKKLTVIDSDGNETTKVYSPATLPTGLSYDTDKKKLSVASNYASSAINLANYASSVVTVDAGKFAKSVNITGNGNDNSIVGGSKSDTLYGGTGNDTLFGGTGNDTFVYSSGKDIITDYTAGQDTVKIKSGAVTKTTYSGKDVIFTVGTGSITVKNGKGKSIRITDSSNKTTTKTYSGTSVSYNSSGMIAEDTAWFVEDDKNIASTETNIASIVEVSADDYSMTSVTSALNYDSLISVQNENQLVYNKFDKK